jgi:hypothetical protein
VTASDYLYRQIIERQLKRAQTRQALLFDVSAAFYPSET